MWLLARAAAGVLPAAAAAFFIVKSRVQDLIFYYLTFFLTKFIAMFVSTETIVDYLLLAGLTGLVWEKNIVSAYNPRSYKPSRTGWR